MSPILPIYSIYRPTEVNEADEAGNTPLHAAILSCTSKCVSKVVCLLISRGAGPDRLNSVGDTPLQMECRLMRIASVDVITSLIGAGACSDGYGSFCSPLSPSSSFSSFLPFPLHLPGEEGERGEERGEGGEPSTPSLSPLTLALIQGASGTVIGKAMIAKILPKQLTSENTQTVGGKITKSTTLTHKTGRHLWVGVTATLIRAGAKWDAQYRTYIGASQLHLLLAAFPPSVSDGHLYRLRGSLFCV